MKHFLVHLYLTGTRAHNLNGSARYRYVVSVPDPKLTLAQIAFSIVCYTGSVIRAGWGLGMRLYGMVLILQGAGGSGRCLQVPQPVCRADQTRILR